MEESGDPMGTLAILILMLISLAIGIYLLLLYAPGLQNVICAVINRVVLVGRGVVVELMWIIYWVLFALLLIIIWAFGNFCRAFPVGTAVCGALTAALLASLTIIILNSFSMIPLYECPMSPMELGRTKACGNGVAPEAFFKEVAEKTMDCWGMYGSGKLNPLTGQSSSNPRNCYIINFNIKGSVTPEQMIRYLQANRTRYNNLTYWEQTGAAIILGGSDYGNDYGTWANPKNSEWYYRKVTHGRLFIKFGDDAFWNEWGSADCNIDSDFSPPMRSSYFSDFTQDLITQAQSCFSGCLAHTPVVQVFGGIVCEAGCLYVPAGCPNICVNRNSGTCSNKCLGNMGSCSSTCVNKILTADSGTLAAGMLDYSNCLGPCNFAPNVVEFGSVLWKTLTDKDYVYWCFDLDDTCNENCKLYKDGTTAC